MYETVKGSTKIVNCFIVMDRKLEQIHEYQYSQITIAYKRLK